MNYKKYLLFLFIFLVACSKQSPPGIDSERVVRDISRLESCRFLSVNKDFFNIQNLKMLYKCTEWDTKFPIINASLYKITPSNWSVFATPINNHLFNDRNIRDRTIGVLNKYDSDTLWNGVGEILVSLNESNFYDTVSQILNCATGNNLICTNIRYRTISEKQVVDIIKLLDVDQRFIRSILSLLMEWNQDSYFDQELYKRVHSNENYLKIRKDILQLLFQHLEEGITVEEEKFLTTFFNDSKKMKMPARDFISIISSGGSQFIKELNDAHGFNSLYRRQLKSVINLYKNGESCVVSGQQEFSFDVKRIFQDFHNKLQIESFKDFQKTFTEKYLEVKYAQEICPNVKNLKTEEGEVFSLSSFLEGTKKFFESDKHFSLIKLVLSKTDTEGFPLFYALRGPGIMEILIDYLSKVYEFDHEYAEHMLERISTKGDEFFIKAIDTVFSRFMVIKKDELKSLNKVWNTIEESEKNFIFNIIDKHFTTENTSRDYLSLYLDLGNVVSERWDNFIADVFIKGPRSLIIPLAEITGSLAGDSILEDFRKFYSRAHLLRVLELITDFTNIEYAKNLLRETLQNLSSTPRDRIVFKPDLGMSCFDNNLEKNRSVFTFVNEFNPACYNNNQQFIPTLTRGLVTLDRLIKKNNSDVVYDENGIFSSHFIRDSFVLMKHIDNSLIKNGNRLSGYILTESRYYEGDIISELGVYLDQILNQNGSKQIDIFMNRLLGQFTDLTNSKNLNNLNRSFDVFSKKLAEKDFSKPLDSIKKCNKQDHYFSSGNACPKFSVFFESLKEFVSYVSRKNENKINTLYLFVKMFKAKEGHVITTDSGKKFTATLGVKESFNVILKMSNKRYKINNTPTPYYNAEGNIIRNQNLTVLERIENTIRDVDFRKNYLGVQYMNAVAYGDNYNEDVKDKKKQLDTCLKVPVVRCGKPMTKAERFQAKNALETYDGLLDANNGRGLEKDFTFEKYLKSLVAAVVDSSLDEARRVRFIPLADKILDGHNGRILGIISKIHGLTHLSRYIQTFGIDSYSNLNFISDLDELFLSSDDAKTVSDTLEQFLKIVVKDSKRLENIVDMISSNEGRYFEKSLFHLVKMSRLVNVDSEKYVSNDNTYYKARYSKNNINEILKVLIGIYSAKEDVALSLKKINWKNIALFMETIDELSDSSNYDERFSAYILVNEVIYQVQEALANAGKTWGLNTEASIENFINFSKDNNISVLTQINNIIDFLVKNRVDIRSSLVALIEVLKEQRTLQMVDQLGQRMELSLGRDGQVGELTSAIKSIVSSDLGLDVLFSRIWGGEGEVIKDDLDLILDQISLLK